MDFSQQYITFSNLQQEPLRLAIALDCCFQDPSAEHRSTYEQYLHRRIRPAVRLLMEREDLKMLEQLDALGWFTEPLLDEFLQTASQLEKPSVFVWLLQKKQSRFGFRRRIYTL